MPYKTKSGTHYHEAYGCCGATEPCGTEGLAPCGICCGSRAGGGDGTAGGSDGSAYGSSSVFSAGSPSGMSATGLFDHEPSTVIPTPEPTDVRVTNVATLRYEATDDYVMRLADSLLAIKASMDAARDGQYAPGADEVTVDSDSLRTVLEALPQASLGPSDLPDGTISPEDVAGKPMSPREAFDVQRQEEFMDSFRRQTTELIRRWDEDEWEEWREAREDLAEYMKGNLRRERPPELSLFIDEEVESLLRRRYEDDVPCPNWHLATQWQRYGRLLTGHEDRWPGYAEAKSRWDRESELIWQQVQARRQRQAQARPKAGAGTKATAVA